MRARRARVHVGAANRALARGRGHDGVDLGVSRGSTGTCVAFATTTRPSSCLSSSLGSASAPAFSALSAPPLPRPTARRAAAAGLGLLGLVAAAAELASAEQVADLLVVDLDEGHVHRVVPALRLELLAVLADLRDRARDDAAHRPVARALHRVRLAGLAYEKRHVVPVERRLHELRDLGEHDLLARSRRPCRTRRAATARRRLAAVCEACAPPGCVSVRLRPSALTSSSVAARRRRRPRRRRRRRLAGTAARARRRARCRAAPGSGCASPPVASPFCTSPRARRRAAAAVASPPRPRPSRAAAASSARPSRARASRAPPVDLRVLDRRLEHDLLGLERGDLVAHAATRPRARRPSREARRPRPRRRPPRPRAPPRRRPARSNSACVASSCARRCARCARPARAPARWRAAPSRPRACASRPAAGRRRSRRAVARLGLLAELGTRASSACFSRAESRRARSRGARPRPRGA